MLSYGRHCEPERLQGTPPDNSPTHNEAATFNEDARILMAPKIGRVGSVKRLPVHRATPATRAHRQTQQPRLPQTAPYSSPIETNRRKDVPLVIRPTNVDLLRANPKLLPAEIVQTAAETPTKIAITNTGAITVDVLSETAANRLLPTTPMGGLQCSQGSPPCT